VKFLIDNQLPAALARFLAARGTDCMHVLDMELGESTDAAIWEYASRNECVVISKDEDFLYLRTCRLQKPASFGFVLAIAARKRFSRQSSACGGRSRPH